MAALALSALSAEFVNKPTMTVPSIYPALRGSQLLSVALRLLRRTTSSSVSVVSVSASKRSL